jgi:hypothetical protein
MKVAILFSGNLRSLDQSIPNFKKNNPELFDSSVADVFVHTWQGQNLSGWKDLPGACWDKTDSIHPAVVTTIFPMSMLTDSFNVIRQIEEVYENSEPYPVYIQNSFIGATYSMAYGWKRVFEIFKQYTQESGKQYDLVIRTRPDLRYEIPLNLEYLAKECASSVLIPQGHDWCGGITDILSISNPEKIEVICNWFDWLRYNITNPEFVSRWHSESYFRIYMETMGLDVKRFLCDHGAYRTVNYKGNEYKYNL